jgi:hypothetical protein
MEILIKLISVVVALNTVVLAYLTYRYFTDKDNTLQDDGATNTDQED